MPRNSTRNTALVCCVPVLLSSCATILNSPTQHIRITTDTSVHDLSVKPALAATGIWQTATGTSSSYTVKRSNQPLVISIKSDSLEKKWVLRPRNSFAFWLNIYANDGLGMLVDRNYPKRFEYPNKIYLQHTETGFTRRRFAPLSKGTLNFLLEGPAVNLFSLQSPAGRYQSGGIFSIGVGLEYFYRENRSLSLTAGLATDRLPIDYFGDRTTADAWQLNLVHNYTVGSFVLGYGINLTGFHWNREHHKDTAYTTQSSYSAGFGPSLSAQYRIGKHWKAGVHYQPDFLRLSSTQPFSYQHSLSVGLSWQLPFHRHER